MTVTGDVFQRLPSPPASFSRVIIMSVERMSIVHVTLLLLTTWKVTSPNIPICDQGIFLKNNFVGTQIYFAIARVGNAWWLGNRHRLAVIRAWCLLVVINAGLHQIIIIIAYYQHYWDQLQELWFSMHAPTQSPQIKKRDKGNTHAHTEKKGFCTPHQKKRRGKTRVHTTP